MQGVLIIATSRLYHHNLLTAATFSGFQVAGGAVANEDTTWSKFTPYAAGRVQIDGQGGYTGDLARDYVLAIHICPDGTLANSRWRWSDTGGASWNQENLTFQDGVWIPLSFGMEVRWTDTTAIRGSPQLVLNDYYYARALRERGITMALDGKRNSEYRSGVMPAGSTLQIGFDLDTAHQPQFLGAKDSNIPANAAVTIRAHPSVLFSTSPSHNQAVTWRANGDMAEVISSGPYRFWWLHVVMGGTSLPYLRLSELFVGMGATFLQPPSIDGSESDAFLGSVDTAVAAGSVHARVHTARLFEYTWENRQDTASGDGGKLQAAFDYATGHPSYTLAPFFFVLLDSDIARTQYLTWVGSGLTKRRHADVLDRFEYQTIWSEVIRRVAS